MFFAKRYPHPSAQVQLILKGLEEHPAIQKAIGYAVEEVNNTQKSLENSVDASRLFTNGNDYFRGMGAFRSTQYASFTIAGVKIYSKMIVHFFGNRPTAVSFQYLRSDYWKLITKDTPFRYTGKLEKLTDDLAIIILNAD